MKLRMEAFCGLGAIALALLPALGAGCTITETGNPGAVPAQMGLTAYSSDPARTALHEGDADFVVEQAWLSVHDLRFVPAPTCDAPGVGEVQLQGALSADLAGPPALFGFRIQPGDYCRVAVPVGPAAGALPPGAPPELAGHSLVVLGRGAGGEPVRIVSGLVAEIDVRAGGSPFTLDASRSALLLTFDVAVWFAQLELEGLEPGPDGTVVIDADSAPERLESFEANVARGTMLYSDGDQDGRLGGGDGELADGDPDSG